MKIRNSYLVSRKKYNDKNEKAYIISLIIQQNLASKINLFLKQKKDFITKSGYISNFLEELSIKFKEYSNILESRILASKLKEMKSYYYQVVNRVDKFLDIIFQSIENNSESFFRQLLENGGKSQQTKGEHTLNWLLNINLVHNKEYNDIEEKESFFSLIKNNDLREELMDTISLNRKNEDSSFSKKDGSKLKVIFSSLFNYIVNCNFLLCMKIADKEDFENRKKTANANFSLIGEKDFLLKIIDAVIKEEINMNEINGLNKCKGNGVLDYILSFLNLKIVSIQEFNIVKEKESFFVFIENFLIENQNLILQIMNDIILDGGNINKILLYGFKELNLSKAFAMIKYCEKYFESYNFEDKVENNQFFESLFGPKMLEESLDADGVVGSTGCTWKTDELSVDDAYGTYCLHSFF